jgi:hypothetical protein
VRPSTTPAETLDAVQNELAMAGHAMLAWDRELVNVWRAGCSRCLGRATVWSEWGFHVQPSGATAGPELAAVHSFRTPDLLAPCAIITGPDNDRSSRH